MKTPTRLLLALLLTLPALGAGIKFNWDASPDPSVTGYILYVGFATNGAAKSNAVIIVPTAGTNALTGPLVSGAVYWAFVTATNASVDGTNSWSESDPSNVINFHIPLPPANLKGHAMLEAAPDLDSPFVVFCDLGAFDVEITEPNQFFRVRIALE